MKHIFLLMMMLGFTSTFLFSQSSDEQAVRQTLERFQAALTNNNADSAGYFLTDDYSFVGPAVMMNKKQRITGMKSGQLKYESLNYEDAKVILYGNTAVVKTTAKIKWNGQDVDLVTLTFAKKEGQWQVAGECIGNSCDR